MVKEVGRTRLAPRLIKEALHEYRACNAKQKKGR